MLGPEFFRIDIIRPHFLALRSLRGCPRTGEAIRTLEESEERPVTLLLVPERRSLKPLARRLGGAREGVGDE